MQRANRLISIIMPAYNSEKFITQAILSVVQQTYPEWELLVIDDCSTDDTVGCVTAMAHQYSKIKLFCNEVNKGVATSRNIGVQKALGDWIAFLDSDDLWEPHKLEKQLSFLQEKAADLIFTGSAFIGERGVCQNFILHTPEKITYRELLKQNLISCSSVMVKKSWIQKYPMPEGLLIHEDFASWLKILQEIPEAHGIDEPLIFYRISASSKSGNKLKAARMNWNTYRYIGLAIPKCIYNMILYVERGIKKYAKLWYSVSKSVQR